VQVSVGTTGATVTDFGYLGYVTTTIIANIITKSSGMFLSPFC